MVSHPHRTDRVHLREGPPDVLGRLAAVETDLLVTEERFESTQFVDRRGTRGARAQTRPFVDERDTLALQCFIVKGRARQLVDSREVAR